MKLRQHLRSQRGQASIVIAMMMMTFILFFAFVVNVGMLVNAKINLQNAADMAAYAGAAVQARQLNTVSFLNYEMRRQYKKFLFRYYVIGNMSQDNFPKSPSESGEYHFPPGDSASANYEVPVVCIVLDARDNFCRIRTLRAISIPNQTALDQVNNTLISILSQIESSRQNSCRSISITNRQLVLYWLFNLDPDLSTVAGALSSAPSQAGALGVIRGLAQGLGLLPKEHLLRERIRTMHGYLNSEPQKGMNKGKFDSYSQSGDLLGKERTIQAFLSAYHTLGPNIFADDEKLVFDELIPATVFRPIELKTSFDVYAVWLDPGEVTTVTTGNGGAKDCKSILFPYRVKKVPIAVKKDPSILTYYAVRLRAPAKSMFSPFGDIVLTAYSAAQPFGSRIAPTQLDEAEYIIPGKKDTEACGAISGGGTDGTSAGGSCSGNLPGLMMLPGKNWLDKGVLGAMFQKFDPEGQPPPAGGGRTIDIEAMDRAYQAAMAPNPTELGKYNIMADLNDDPFVDYFDTQDQVGAIYAPLFSSDATAQSEQVKQKLREMVDDIAEGRTGSATAGDETAQLKAAMLQALDVYINKLRQGQGEFGESFNVVRITNPYATRPVGGQSRPITLGGGLLMNDPAQVKSSWNGVRDSNLASLGRTGYSVKFVSFKQLIQGGAPTDGNGTMWNNPPEADATAGADFPLLDH